MSRIIGVVSGKGGVGKTTVVTNLSTALATRFNKEITVIDCNVTTSHLSMHFGAYFHPLTLNNVLKDEASVEEAIFRHSSGVKVIPASLNLSDLVGVDISILYYKISDLFENEDFVFLAKACKEALIVTTPNIPAITDVIRGKGVLKELGVEPLGIILNKVIGKKFELTTREVVQLTDLPILAKIPYDLKLLESLAAKAPIVVYDEKSTVSLEFFKLASMLTGEVYEPPKLGFFEKLSRVFRRSS